MATKLTITRNGTSTSYEISGSTAAIVYNGSTLATLSPGQTKTLNCANKVAATNIVIGGKTLNCGGKLMPTNVVVKLEYVYRTITISGNGNPSGYSVQAAVNINGTDYSSATTVSVVDGTTITLKAWGTVLKKGSIWVNGTKVSEGTNQSYTVTVTQNCTVSFDGTQAIYGKTSFTG